MLPSLLVQGLCDIWKKVLNSFIVLILNLLRMIPSISYENLWLIHSSSETDRTEIHTSRLLIG